jgi:peptidoglycan hydrolase CwlO-like protein
MDKKAKKRIEMLHKKINDLQQRLAGARKQMDDDQEVRQLEKELAAAKEEIDKLKST